MKNTVSGHGAPWSSWGTLNPAKLRINQVPSQSAGRHAASFPTGGSPVTSGSPPDTDPLQVWLETLPAEAQQHLRAGQQHMVHILAQDVKSRQRRSRSV